MEKTLLLIRVSHPSPKVNCSVVSAPLGLGSCWCSLVSDLQQCSAKRVGRKHPPELLRAGRLSSSCECPSSAVPPGIRMALWLRTGSSFLRLCPGRWPLLRCCGFVSPLGVSLRPQSAWAEGSAVCVGFAMHTPPPGALKPFRPRGCHASQCLLLPTPYSRKVKSVPSHITTSGIIIQCRTKIK